METNKGDAGNYDVTDAVSSQQQLLANNFNLYEPPTTSNVEHLPDLTMTQQNSWCCHLHSSSSAECSMRLIGAVYYHVVPVKTVSRDAQRYNMQNTPNEYWESLDFDLFVSPVAYFSHINDFSFFNRICAIFQLLDDSRMKFIAQNTPGDFIKRHIICTANGSRINLCNKHLIKIVGSASTNTASNGAASDAALPSFGLTKVYGFYTRPNWIRGLLKALFPQLESAKNGLSPTIPVWAINLYQKQRNIQGFDVGPYEISSLFVVGGGGNQKIKRLKKS